MADINDDELRDAVNRMIDNFNLANGKISGAGAQAANRLNQMATSSDYVNNQFRALSGSSATLYNVDSQRGQIGKQLVDTFRKLTQSTLNAVDALYGVPAGFSSFSRTLVDVQEFVDSTIKILSLGLITSLQPQLVLMGSILKGLNESVLPVLFGAMKLQLGLMEKQLNMYKQVNQTGAIFGGSLSNLQKAAQSAGTGVDILGNIIKGTGDRLSELGLSMSLGGYTVAQYASTLARTDRAMLNLYGSTEELAAGTADYLSLQAQVGKTDLNNQAANSKGLREYLRTTKELSDITGKRASQLKSEEDARRNELAYNLKIGRLGDDAKRNVTEGMAVATKLFGTQGAKFAQEFFATDGRVVSPESLRFQAMMPEAAAAIAEMVSATGESKDQYRARIGSYLDANKEVFQQIAKDYEALAEINYGANNPILTAMTGVGTSIRNSAGLINNINDLFKKAKDEAAKADQGADPITKTIQDAEKIRLDNQLAIDKIVKENFNKMSSIIQILGKLQQLQIVSAGFVVDLATTALGKTSDASLAALELLKKLQSDTNTPPTPGTTRPPPIETRASGGVVNKPVIAGEDGPEAVIPLAKGNVPLDIDWTPMTRAMYELIDKVQEGNDINDKILKASY